MRAETREHLEHNADSLLGTKLRLGGNSVNWNLHFERRLDPAWYFRPWERYATHLAAEYLIRANATPAPQKQGE
jgi:hypothetical protein